MQTFIKKSEAIKYHDKFGKKKADLQLFQEDIDRAGSKCFYVCTPNALFKRMEKTAEPHLYESWTGQTQMVFGTDIDYDMTKDNIKPDDLLKKIIKMVIEAAKTYYNHEYKISDIIVLENDKLAQQLDKPNKYSAHIIFRGLNFANHLVTKDFYMRMEKDYQISSLYVDKNIYNLGCLRLFLSSKMGRHAILTQKKLKVGNHYTKTMRSNQFESMYDFFLQTMITHTNSTDKMIELKDIKFKTNNTNPKLTDNHNIKNINIQHILDNLPEKYYDEYELWTTIGMILQHHSTTENDYYEMWNEWSMKSPKYKRSEMVSKWKSFNTSNRSVTVGTLIKWAKDEQIDNIYINKKPNLNDIIESYPQKPVVLTTDHLSEHNMTILDMPKLNPQIFEPLIQRKLVAVQSEKGTGKTSNLFKALFDSNKSWLDENTSILFISMRVTFGYKLLGDLETYGFELYSKIKEHDIYAKRLICQLDSLSRIKRDSYDIVIVDECESLARYITSSNFVKKPNACITESDCELRIAEAGQVYIMDADLSDRCINFYHNLVNPSIDNFHLVINKFKPYTDYTLKCSSYNTWVRTILLFLEQQKRLVVAMASNSKAKDLQIFLTETFKEKKVLLIHRETSDEEKKNLLLNVNEEWAKYDVIIYTPSVCMGVSFDIVGHFDNIFAYGCHETLPAQEWCQMIHRVRSPKSKDIYIAIDQYVQFDESEHVMTYSEMERLITSDKYLTSFDLHNNLLGPRKKRVRNHIEITNLKHLDFNNENSDSDNESESDPAQTNQTAKTAQTNQSAKLAQQVQSTYKPFRLVNRPSIKSISALDSNDIVIEYRCKSEPMYDLYIRNSWEKVENRLNFPACFFGYAKYKSYRIETITGTDADNEISSDLKIIRTLREQYELENNTNGILNAPDVDYDQYQSMIKMENSSTKLLTAEDRYAIRRYNLRKCYTINLPNFDPDVEINEENENISNGVISYDFILEFNDDTLMKYYRNLSMMLSIPTQTTKMKLEILRENEEYDQIITNCYIDLTHKNAYFCHYYALHLIEILGFDINDLSIKQQQLHLITRIYEASAEIESKADQISFKFGMKSIKKLASNKLSDLTDVQQLKFINEIIKSQYGLIIKKTKYSSNIDLVEYGLDDNAMWTNLPNRPLDIPDNLKLPDNKHDLRRKIIPIELKRKNKTNTQKFTQEDLFIDD